MAFGAGQGSGINVTSTVHDYDTASPVPNLLLMRSDGYNGSGQATYNTGGKCPSNCLTTIVGTSGGWQLDLYNQSLRTVCLTFMTADGSTPVPANGCYSASIEIYSRCFDANGSEIGILTIAPGTSANHCDFALDFSTASRTKYKLAMGQPGLTSPPTGLATVSCNSGSGGTCNSWTIVPNMIAANPTIANLYQYSTKGALVFVGQYYNTFRIDATNP
jgi:hypothetical protein